MSLLLTKPFTDELTPFDDHRAFGVMLERTLREIAWRRQLDEGVVQVSLVEVVPATDAGHVCHVCGEIVSWVEHLPPVSVGDPVRCYVNVRSLPAARAQKQLGPGVSV